MSQISYITLFLLIASGLTLVFTRRLRGNYILLFLFLGIPALMLFDFSLWDDPYFNNPVHYQYMVYWRASWYLALVWFVAFRNRGTRIWALLISYIVVLISAPPYDIVHYAFEHRIYSLPLHPDLQSWLLRFLPFEIPRFLVFGFIAFLCAKFPKRRLSSPLLILSIWEISKDVIGLWVPDRQSEILHFDIGGLGLLFFAVYVFISIAWQQIRLSSVYLAVVDTVGSVHTVKNNSRIGRLVSSNSDSDWKELEVLVDQAVIKNELKQAEQKIIALLDAHDIPNKELFLKLHCHKSYDDLKSLLEEPGDGGNK